MQGTSVLIVEDEAIIAADLAGKLGQLGYRVVGTTATGEEAVEMAGRLAPGVVLMDIRLKGALDGIQAAEAIRHLDLPVVFLTAHSDQATLERALATEPFGYILKPFEERELAITIEMALFKHRSERDLREQREWLRVTLTSIGDAVITCDTEARVTFLNPIAETLTGWRTAEAGNLPIHEVLPLINEKTGEPPEDPVALVLREGRPKALANHVALVTRDGRQIPIEDSAAPILDAGGRVIGAVLVFHDVTQKRRAEEELIAAKRSAEEANRAKGQFLGNMSHELRTPMTGVLGMLDLALEGDLDPQQMEYLTTARTSGQALLRIINDILDLTKIEAGTLGFAQEPFPLKECLDAAVDLLLPEAHRKMITLSLTLEPSLPQSVVGDRGRLQQVLVNLVGNAVKFTEKGGVEVRVAAGAADEKGRRSVTFSVSDTGIGIPSERQKLLFESFSQVNDSDTRIHGGAGLGLALSRKIAQSLGGTITFESEEGVGSTFTLRLPLAETLAQTLATAEELAPSALAPTPTTAPSKGRILLVEDDPVTRQVLGGMLKRARFEFDVADDGMEGVRMYGEGEYDIVLMDMQMPRLDGLAATRMIREKEEQSGRKTPIVAITARVEKAEAGRCLQAGMDAYLAKPIDFKACIEVIEGLIGKK